MNTDETERAPENNIRLGRVACPRWLLLTDNSRGPATLPNLLSVGLDQASSIGAAPLPLSLRLNSIRVYLCSSLITRPKLLAAKG
jgi:hypothetical protein